MIQLPMLENGTSHMRHAFFLPDDQIQNVAATFQNCKNNRVCSRLTVYLLKCLITKCMVFLEVIRVFLIFVNESSMTNAKYQGFHVNRKVEEHCVVDVYKARMYKKFLTVVIC